MIFLNRHILLSTLFAFSILNSTFSQDVYSKIDSIKSEILKLDNQKNSLLSELETFEFSRNKLELIEYVLPKLQSEEKLIEGRRDFYNFFNEMDDRRETDILSVYPELLDFYKLCQQVSLTNPL